MNTKANSTIWTPQFLGIFIANFAMNMGQFMMNTLIPKYVRALGALPTIVGLVTSLFAVTALLVRPVVGPAADYYSKKKLYGGAIFTIMLAFFGYSVSKSVEMMMAFRLLHGIGMGFYGPVGLALATAALPKDKLGSGISIYSLGQAIAQAIGPSIGLSLSAKIGYNPTFLIGAVVMGAAVVTCFLIREDYNKPTVPFRLDPSKIIAVDAILPAIMYIFLSCAYSCINSFLAITGELRGIEQIGLFFTAYAGLMIFFRPVTGKIQDKFGLSYTVIPACLIFIAAFLLLSVATQLWMFLVAAVLVALGYGSMQPAVQAMCMRSVLPEQRSAAANTNYFGADLGNLLGPVVGGAVASASMNAALAGVAESDTAAIEAANIAAYSGIFRIMTIPIIIALVIFLVFRKKLVANYTRKIDG